MILFKVLKFYYDGFKEMTWGKTLWLIIIIKLVVIFLFLKVIFFPSKLSGSKIECQNIVGSELINRGSK